MNDTFFEFMICGYYAIRNMRPNQQFSSCLAITMTILVGILLPAAIVRVMFFKPEDLKSDTVIKRWGQVYSGLKPTK